MARRLPTVLRIWCFLSLFSENVIGLSGLGPVGQVNLHTDLISGLSPDVQDHQHTDLHALGTIGYIELYYQRDGTNIAIAVLYHKSDKGFAPLRFREPFPQKLDLDQATFQGLGKWLGSYVVPDGYRARLAWDNARFKEVQEWLHLHLPSIIDLGIITVSTNKVTHVNLGTNAECMIRTFIHTRPRTTNEYYSLTLSFGNTNTPNSHTSTSVDRPGQPIGFAFDGKFYRLTPKLQKE